MNETERSRVHHAGEMKFLMLSMGKSGRDNKCKKKFGSRQFKRASKEKKIQVAEPLKRWLRGEYPKERQKY